MSCGISWTGETPQELAPRRLTASPAESEAPGTEINSLPNTAKKKSGNIPRFFYTIYKVYELGTRTSIAKG